MRSSCALRHLLGRNQRCPVIRIANDCLHVGLALLAPQTAMWEVWKEGERQAGPTAQASSPTRRLQANQAADAGNRRHQSNICARLANLLTAQGLMENLLVQTLTQHNVSRECRKTKIQTRLAQGLCGAGVQEAPSATSYRKLGYIARREDSHPTSHGGGSRGARLHDR